MIKEVFIEEVSQELGHVDMCFKTFLLTMADKDFIGKITNIENLDIDPHKNFMIFISHNNIHNCKDSNHKSIHSFKNAIRILAS